MIKLNVVFDGRVVGYLVKHLDKYLFEYDDNWLINGFSISPFSLPLKKGVFVPKNNNFNGLFGVFSDSLPDAWGNLLLDRYSKKKNIDADDMLKRLSIIGDSGMGALEYQPNIELRKSLVVNLDEYQIESNKLLCDEDTNIDLLFLNGGSSGGARPKANIKIDDEYWIVKFQSRFDRNDIGICEYDYALACIEIGIDMPKVKLFKSNINSGYFGIQRFDRVNNRKVHMITAAALLEADFRSPCLDYNDLFKLTRIITNNNVKDLENLFLRMCFNVYAHNLDDHTKNFSFIYDGYNYRLSPAYDMVYSNTYFGEHTTSINGKGKDILDEDLILVGRNAKLGDKFILESINKVKTIVNHRLSKYLK